MTKQLEAVLREVLNQPAKGNLAYAQSYTRAIFEADMRGRELKCQLGYVLVNLSYWKGFEARRVKKIIIKEAHIL